MISFGNFSFWTGLIIGILGLITSVVSIILSIVAIKFSSQVDARSDTVNRQTIESLKKIESDVNRTSADVAEIIRFGWQRMFETYARANSLGPMESLEGIKVAGGLAEPDTDVESMSQVAPASMGPQTANRQEVSQRIEERTSQIEPFTRPNMSPVDPVLRLAEQLASLSPEARGIARYLVRVPRIGVQAFDRLAADLPKARQALDELFSLEVIGVSSGNGKHGERFIIPYTTVANLRAALSMASADSSDSERDRELTIFQSLRQARSSTSS